LTNLFHFIPLIPNKPQDLAYSSFSFEEGKRRFLPPTLPTFAGTRGLLLYTPALEMQAAGEATIFDESGQVGSSSVQCTVQWLSGEIVQSAWQLVV